VALTKHVKISIFIDYKPQTTRSELYHHFNSITKSELSVAA